MKSRIGSRESKTTRHDQTRPRSSARSSTRSSGGLQTREDCQDATSGVSSQPQEDRLRVYESIMTCRDMSTGMRAVDLLVA